MEMREAAQEAAEWAAAKWMALSEAEREVEAERRAQRRARAKRVYFKNGGRVAFSPPREDVWDSPRPSPVMSDDDDE